KLPEFVYFNHSIRINRGVSCNVCHGPIQKQQITLKSKPFFMKGCVDCHRNPEGFLGEKKDIFERYVNAQRGDKLVPKVEGGKTVMEKERLSSAEMGLLNDPG